MTSAEIMAMPMPEIAVAESHQAHGKLLLTALYEPDPIKRGAARRALVLLLDMADHGDA